MSKSVMRVGVDAAGGVITTAISTKTTVGGHPVVCVGAADASHGTGAHSNAHMVSGSSKTTANGAAICGVGDSASCGHTGTSGSPSTSYG